MFGDKWAVVVTVLDGCGKSAVQTRPLGLELRFVCHRTIRMTEHILGVRRELNLVEEFGLDERGHVGSSTSVVSSCSLSLLPTTAAALMVRWRGARVGRYALK